MKKPTVFISHSSKDVAYLELLKRKLDARTAGVVKFFLSSDGQSIPFGTNWIHGIESALQAATIMFTAVSPASVTSSWLYFESGYAYSRGVRVIPIGINSASIETLRPPLSLLQGFNIRSHDGLNNLIAVINQQYQLNFREDFNEKDYLELTSLNAMHLVPFSSTLRFVDRIEIDFPTVINQAPDGSSLKAIASPEEAIKEVFKNANITISLIDEVTMHGSGILLKLNRNINKNSSSVSITVDPIVLDKILLLLPALVNAIYNQSPEYFWFSIILRKEIRALTANYKISSRLSAFGVQISDKHGNLYEYENALFALTELRVTPGAMPVFPTKMSFPVSIRVVFPLHTDPPVRIERILELLERAGIIDDSEL
ncbi:MAG: toll/interleukin-1 receptor domain-containing protein [Candidatus Aminicenantes bacterium]|nr:toll/interleukin-1 receptor domain-containing protein [Candidatus Aminicenantes bacterium]